MQKNSMDVDHEVDNIGSVQIPFIKAITNSTIKSMMNKYVRSGEVPWHITVKYSDPIFEKVPDRISEPLFI